jgi:hypothetical protein
VSLSREKRSQTPESVLRHASGGGPICLHTAEATGSIPVAPSHRRETAAYCDPVRVRSARRHETGRDGAKRCETRTLRTHGHLTGSHAWLNLPKRTHNPKVAGSNPAPLRTKPLGALHLSGASSGSRIPPIDLVRIGCEKRAVQLMMGDYTGSWVFCRGRSYGVCPSRPQWGRLKL